MKPALLGALSKKHGVAILATGENILTTYNGYVYHTFTSSGTLAVAAPVTAEVLTISGGGAGGMHHSTLYTTYGGGAGGVIHTSSTSLTPGNYTVTIGSGGSTSYTTVGVRGGNGTGSTFGSLGGPIGGGGGGSSSGLSAYGGTNSQDGSTGQNGGSGGGGSPSGSATIGGQGNNGALGGGGGAGSSATSTSPGNGTTLYAAWALASQRGINSFFASGGGSSDYIGVTGGGGSGGGPAPWGGPGVAGSINTGSGGGGSGKNQDQYIGAGQGGSGIVIVRYPGSNPNATAVTAPSGIPTNTSIPTISGSASNGSTLSKSSDGSWTGSPTSFEYKWQYSNDGTYWGDRTSWGAYSDRTIAANSVAQYPWQYFTMYPNRTSSSNSFPQFMNGSPDQGLYYRLAVRAINSGGTSEPAYSSSIGQIPSIPIYTGGSSWVGSLSSGSTGYASFAGWSTSSNQWIFQYFYSPTPTGSQTFTQIGATDASGNTLPGWANGRNYTIPSAARFNYLGVVLFPIGGSVSGGSGPRINLGYVP